MVPSARCMKKLLCRWLCSLWKMLMVFTLVYVAVQILEVVWPSRSDKLADEGLLNPRFAAETLRPLLTQQNGRAHQFTKPSLFVRGRELSPLDEEGAVREQQRGSHSLAEPRVGNQVERRDKRLEGYLKPLNDILPRRVTLNEFTNFQTEISVGKQIAPEDLAHIKKLNQGLPDSSVLQQEENVSQMPVHHSSSDSRGGKFPQFHTRKKSLTASTEQKTVKTPTLEVSSLLDHSSSGKKSMCQPKNHIMFLKTHKTASSTILNILYRYGDSRNLTFALPLHKHSQLFYPYFFATHFVEGVSSKSVREFHIMCNHLRFKKSEVAKVMAEDTFYFSILRNPVAMMESVFVYYKSIPAFLKVRSLADFLDNAWHSYNKSLSGNHYARNLLAFDFGFENNYLGDAQVLEERAMAAIAAIEQDFHLILISEYFDESMILLKHALCWSLDDVISFKLNSRSERSRLTVSPHTADQIRAWNALDWRFYVYFNTTFWHKVDTLVGREEMKKEVASLRERREQLTKTCLKDGGSVDPSHVKDASLKPFQYGAAVIQGFNLNPTLDGPKKIQCQRLITPELQYTDLLYSKQFPELAAKHKKAAKMLALQRQLGSKRTSMIGQAHRRTSRLKDPYMKKQNDPTSAPIKKPMPKK
ncbi:galactose-3-O-sulfotransferase 2 [Lampris incognitus]|uniref:galactose-3-O-sulfotransferase 2 n=1 Tax=Lampris incognitus TaxID=2546036 RepID=UPI0024B62EAB|nr:galactose-3-O-sulfotransferase 2 [Lampris incognitus]